MKRLVTLALAIVVVCTTLSVDVKANGFRGGNRRSGSFSSSRNTSSSRSFSQQRFASSARTNVVRDHRTPTSTIVRDHRTPTRTTVVRDHRNGSNTVIRDHRTNSNSTIRPRPVLGSPKAPQARPFPKPLDPGIGNGKPGVIKPTPRPSFPNIGTRPRPPFGQNNGGIVGGVKPRPRPTPPAGTGAPQPRPRPTPPAGTGAPKPRPFPKPLDPGIGNGQPANNHGHNNNNHGHHNNHGNNHHHYGRPWFNFKPRHCWWWANYCRPLVNYRPIDYSYCNYSYATCDYQFGGNVLVDTKWYLGIGGLILPGKGFGIEKVDENSPAELSGLVAGVVITRCNGIVIENDADFSKAIAQSNGVLEMEVLDKLDGEPAQVVVQMQRLVVASY